MVTRSTFWSGVEGSLSGAAGSGRPATNRAVPAAASRTAMPAMPAMPRRGRPAFRAWRRSRSPLRLRFAIVLVVDLRHDERHGLAVGRALRIVQLFHTGQIVERQRTLAALTARAGHRCEPHDRRPDQTFHTGISDATYSGSAFAGAGATAHARIAAPDLPFKRATSVRAEYCEPWFSCC